MEICARTGGDGFSDSSCFFRVRESQRNEKVQCAILLHLIGNEGLEIDNTFTFAEGKAEESVLKKNFEDCVNPRKNTVLELYKFWE
jgi:hypothetical protein